MRTLSFTLPFFMVILLAGCAATQAVSTITGGEYDKEKDNTGYFVLPFGSVSLPGEWKKTHYNQVSHQQFFEKDSVEIAIAFNACNNYEFNLKGKHTGYDFVTAFYEWDSQYFVDAYGLKRELIETDSTRHYLVYRIFGQTQGMSIDSYYLVAEQNGAARNYSIASALHWTAEEKVAFLKELYMP
jgi:hypothetical protein